MFSTFFGTTFFFAVVKWMFPLCVFSQHRHTFRLCILERFLVLGPFDQSNFDLVVSTFPEFLALSYVRLQCFKQQNMPGRRVHVNSNKVNATVTESLKASGLFHVDGKYQVLTFAHVKYTKWVNTETTVGEHNVDWCPVCIQCYPRLTIHGRFKTMLVPYEVHCLL